MLLSQSVQFVLSLSFRTKLLLLLLLIFLPIFGVVISSGLANRRHEIEASYEKALMLVQSLAAQQEDIACGTRQMLSIVALLPEVKNRDTEACNLLLQDLNRQHPFYSVIALISPDGKIIATSIPLKTANLNLSDRKYIKDVIRSLEFSAGEYSIGMVGGTPSITYSYPVLDIHRELIAIVIASFRLDEFAGFIRDANLPEGSAVTISDHKGMRLYRYPESEMARTGQALPEDVVKRMSSWDSEQGIFEKTGHDGIERIYAFRRLHLRGNALPYMFVDVGLPKAEIVRTANREMFRNLSILGALCLVMMSLAWAFGQFFFVNPINRLLMATERLSGGDFNTRTSFGQTSDELGRLARAFDNMAMMLEQRNLERASTERSLRKAEENYRNIFENAVVGIYTCTPAGRFIEANHALARILGYGSPKEMKDAVKDLCRQVCVNPQKGLECIRSALDQGKASVEIEVWTKDGSSRWVANHIGVVRDDRGDISHFEGVVEDISLRVQAEEKWREYENVVEGLEEMIAVIDKDYRYLIANRSLLNYLNLERDQVVGHLVSEIVGKEKFETVVKNKMDMCFQGKTVNYEIRYEYPIVGERDLFITYLPIIGRSTVDRIASIVRDITEKKIAERELERYRNYLEDIVIERTSELENANIALQKEVNERKKIENELRLSETKYRTLVEQIPAITYLEAIGDRPELLYVSPQIESMLGIAREECIVDNTLKLKTLHPDDRERVLSQLKKLRQEGSPFTSEYRMIGRSGNIKWFLDEARVVNDSFGKPMFLHGVMLDISDKKRIEEALRYSENFYRTMFESTGTAMAIVEEDTTISLANAQFENFTGFSRNDIEGRKSWTEFVDKGDWERLKRYHALRRTNPDLAPKQYETQLVDRLGKKRYVVANVAMIPNTQKSVISLLDITDRKIVEEDLERFVAELNNLQRITRNFLQLEDVPSILHSIAEGIVVTIGYDMAIVAIYQEKERILTGFATYPAQLTNVMEQCSEKNTKGNIYERKLKCVDGQNPVLDRILKGETVIDGSLNTFISQWVSSANACQIQNLAGRKGYICLPMRVKHETVGLILAVWNDDGKDLKRMRNALDRVASLAALAIKGAWLFKYTSNQRKKLRALSARLLELQEAERKRIAQELHDRVGQNLTGISINLGIIRSFLPPEEMKKVQSRLVDCVELVGNTMSCIRDVMAELDPPGLSDYGLEVAIKCYCDQFSKRTGLNVSVVNTGGMEDAFLLAREGKIALFRIAQEALTNAARHSKATEVIVSLNVTAEELVLSVADNGVGFDVDDQTFFVDGGRFGIGYMRERAEAIGGEFRMESTPGKGTRIIVSLIRVKR